MKLRVELLSEFLRFLQLLQRLCLLPLQLLLLLGQQGRMGCLLFQLPAGFLPGLCYLGFLCLQLLLS